jgi:hypothetical protein
MEGPPLVYAASNVWSYSSCGACIVYFAARVSKKSRQLQGWQTVEGVSKEFDGEFIFICALRLRDCCRKDGIGRKVGAILVTCLRDTGQTLAAGSRPSAGAGRRSVC